MRLYLLETSVTLILFSPQGCARKMLKLMETYSLEVLGVLLAILLIEILAMVFSIILCCTVRRIDHVKA